MPKRIQRKRTKGWRMPENAVYVGRPTKWGNPFLMSECRTRRECIIAFNTWLKSKGPMFGEARRQQIKSDIGELRGKDLACWCPLDQPCHADILLAMANVEGE